MPTFRRPHALVDTVHVGDCFVVLKERSEGGPPHVRVKSSFARLIRLAKGCTLARSVPEKAPMGNLHL